MNFGCQTEVFQLPHHRQYLFVSCHFMKHPENLKEFMIWFKRRSEKYFETIELEMDVAGLQYQKGTKWSQGLTTKELIDFQNELGFEFPDELAEFYKLMNGTDLLGVNVYAEQGLPYYYAPICFSYPEHLPKIKHLIQERLDMNGLTIEQMKRDGIPFIFPVDDYHFMVIDKVTNPIYYLSIAHKNHDINQGYVYGSLWTDTYQSWLIKNVFFQTKHPTDLEEFPNRQRVTNYWTTPDDS